MPPQPEDCYKFPSCNAALCPLDATNQGQHLPGEAICLGMRTLVKLKGTSHVADAFGAIVGDRLQGLLPTYRETHPDIARRLARAARTGSKLQPRSP